MGVHASSVLCVPQFELFCAASVPGRVGCAAKARRWRPDGGPRRRGARAGAALRGRVERGGRGLYAMMTRAEPVRLV